MKTFNLPDLGEGLPDGEIQQWYIQEGETVEKDQPLVAMETAKAVVDVPSPFEGKVAKLYGKPGDTIDTGAPLVGYEETDAGPNPDPDPGAVVGHVESSDALVEEEVTSQVVQRPRKAAGFKALPAARALAKKLDVDLSQVQGSGKQGVITPEDVERVAQGAQIEPGFQPLKGFRRVMAHQMVRAHQSIVPTTIFDDALIGHWGKDVDITVRLLQALIEACQKAPYLNAHFDGDQVALKHFDAVNVAIAVDTEHGLYMPVIKHAEKLDAKALRAQIDTFKDKIQQRSITPQDMDGGTISFSNYGTISGRYATPVIVPPMVGILGIGRLHNDVVADNNQVSIQKSVPLSLTFDHRAVTGGEAAQFLRYIIEALER